MFSCEFIWLKSGVSQGGHFYLLPLQTLKRYKAIKLAQHPPLAPPGDPHLALISVVNFLCEIWRKQQILFALESARAKQN